MEAATLHCPNCGAAVSSGATRCSHCNSRLASVACPSCFGMIFEGSKFCPHCGAKVTRQELDPGKPRPCPRCQVDTQHVVIGGTELRECPKCEGLWVGKDALQQICTDRERQAAVLGAASEAPAGNIPLEKVRYLPCPICRKLMNRVNFAGCSGVVVDVCKAHGTWFDRDELHRIVEFIQGGGMERARANEIAQLEERRRELSAAQMHRQASPLSGHETHPFHGALSCASAALLSSFFD